MSTEHQKYSAKNQSKAIREYAEAHDMEIVRTYADEGKSGLRIKGCDAGIEVEYCAEQFANDGSPVATIVKGVKRAMAGEYGRELSAKVFAGQCRLIELGFRQGGMAGYGLRRMRVDQNGDSQGILGFGEHKSLQTERVILVPGPDEEVQTVRWIYREFIDGGKQEAGISRMVGSDPGAMKFIRTSLYGV